MLTNIKISNRIVFFLISFASILRFNNGDISLFNIVIAFYFLLFLLKKDFTNLDISFFIIPLLLIGYSLLIKPDFIVSLNILAGIITIYIVLNSEDEQTYHGLLISFILGIFLSSLIALFFYNTERFIELMRIIKWEGGLLPVRFSGLANDPNFYSVFLALALLSLIKLKFGGKMSSWVFYFYAAMFSFFGFLTVSKSFFLIYVIIYIYYIILLFRNDINSGTIFLICSIILAIIAYFTFARSIVSGIIERLFNDASDLNRFTTNRLDIWINYLSYIFSNLNILLFGNGLAMDLYQGVAAHNTFIQMIYLYGFFGSIVVLCFVIKAYKTFKNKFNPKNKPDYFHYFIILAMMFFLDFLYFDTLYHLMVILFGNNFLLKMNNIKNVEEQNG